MKTRSPQTMGLELPGPGRGAFQRTFSIVFHLRGTFVSGECPWPSVPRQAGQFSAKAGAEKHPRTIVARKTERITASSEIVGRILVCLLLYALGRETGLHKDSSPQRHKEHKDIGKKKSSIARQ
jgi:hypothetical protein